MYVWNETTWVKLGQDCDCEEECIELSYSSNSLIIEPSGNVTEGTAVTFRLPNKVQGSEPISYQWSSEGVDIPGATSDTYTTIAGSSSVFICKISNECTATPVWITGLLTVTPACTNATITGTGSLTPSIKESQSTTLNVTATGTSLTYQWYKGNIGSGTAISGATSASYTYTANEGVGNYQFYCVVNSSVSECNAPVTSGQFTVNVSCMLPVIVSATPAQRPVITNPSSGTLPTLNVTATGNALTYQWYYKDYNSTGGFILVSGATSNTYQPNYQKLGLYQYKCVVTSRGECSVESDILEVVWGCGAYGAEKEKWLVFRCHNLGADESRDPFTWRSNGDLVDNDIKGFLYQWGRRSDGHEKRSSVQTETLATNDQATLPSVVVGKNIKTYMGVSDWRSGGGSNSRWGDGTQNAVMPKAANDPCPTGWKVPSHSQWTSIFAGSSNPSTSTSNTWTWTGSGFKVGDALYLPAAGQRQGLGGVSSVGTGGNYWSSAVLKDSPGFSTFMFFRDGMVSPYTYTGLGTAMSIRCIAVD